MAKQKIFCTYKQMKEMIDNDMTFEEIGKILKCTHQHCSYICKKLNIKAKRTGPRNAEKHPEWNGGKIIDKDGYILIYRLNHPMARKPRNIYVAEHRLVMSEFLGRQLKKSEVVHHKDRNKKNNSLNNLELFENNSLHLKYELKGKVPNWTDKGKLKLRQSILKRADMYRKNPKSNDSLKHLKSVYF